MPTAAKQKAEGMEEDASALLLAPAADAGSGGAMSGTGAQDVSAEEAAAIAEAEAAETKLPPIASQIKALKTNRAAAEVRLAAAAGNSAAAAGQPAGVSKSERSLLIELRDSRRELEEAEAANARALERLAAAKEVYDHCAQLLAGYTPLEARLSAQRRAEAGGMDVDVEEGTVEMLGQPEAENIAQSMNMEEAAAVLSPRVRGHVQPEGEVVLPTNDVYLPEHFKTGGGMNEVQVASFRDGFYRNLTKGQSGAETIDEWQPPPNNANLKSKAQLAEMIHICKHWNTGADGLDPGAFRNKHKTWYARMKPAAHHLGRRTGLHLRQTTDPVYEGQPGSGGQTVLCRYGKDGTKSVAYLEVGRLFDALFQIHALELGHRGRDATKNLADERYANVPDATVRAFLDACPACASKKPMMTHYHQPTGV